MWNVAGALAVARSSREISVRESVSAPRASAPWSITVSATGWAGASLVSALASQQLMGGLVGAVLDRVDTAARTPITVGSRCCPASMLTAHGPGTDGS